MIAKRIIRVSMICGHLPTDGKSIVLDSEVKTVRTIDVSVVYVSERSPVILGLLNVNYCEVKDC